MKYCARSNFTGSASALKNVFLVGRIQLFGENQSVCLFLDIRGIILPLVVRAVKFLCKCIKILIDASCLKSYNLVNKRELRFVKISAAL